MWGQILGGLGSLFSGGGGLFAGAQPMMGYQNAIKDLKNMPGMTGPQGIGGSFGQVGANGQFAMDPSLAMGQMGLAGSLGGMLGGGLFNDPRFQQAWGQNDISGALGQANQAFGQQAGSSAFGGLGGMYGQLSNQFNQGPIDYSSGAQNALISQGLQNQLAAGNQQQLYQQSLDLQRQMAAPQQNRDQLRMMDQLKAKGLLGAQSTATGEAFRGYQEAKDMQDLGFQNNAFGQSLAQQQFLGNLGAQQMGQGQGFLGANLGQYNQTTANLMGLEGQQFGQALQGMGFNTSQGMNRLQSAMGLFGQGADIFGQNYGLGTNAANQLLGYGNFGLQAARSPFELQAGLLQGSGEHAKSLYQANQGLGEAKGDFFGSLASGVGGIVKGLFSDRRLKDNVVRIGSLGDLNWYEWQWNSTAKELGIEEPNYGVMAQEVAEIMPEAVYMDKSGYLKVDYSILGV